ncbi:hypothetical protein HYH02_009348 [Chlamydomonas schloesseri]|uniref:VWFA domain-containing protein n=1 Tax=Chlamydomonas schloesseri TaxID=2026947 RepID=A0A835W9I8_9CHLO|nr:hypothetical protein HYH02_009348 [Chlamydomonas schloesseri]|eukprot:KAG2443278.1 hypothetical protein HYH02_009348 [Chlamydomonas schloesseri]
MTIEVGDWLSKPSTGVLPPSGVFIEGGEKPIPVPLRRRDVSAIVYAAASFSDTKETLSYVSDVECSAVFRFPLPPRAAVYRFRAVFGDREVVTKVKPRAAAREEFDLAVSQGHSAVHMSQHEAGASVFEVSLGNLEAHTEVTVEFSYLRLLDAFGGTLEWSHTATWVPPYVGSAGDVATGVDKVASALPSFAAKVTYALSYEVTVRAEAGTVRAIESPEPVAVERPVPSTSGSAGEEEVWRVRLSEQVADPSKDLTLAIELDPKAARRSGLRVQRTPTSRGGEQRTVALATFVPPLPSASASAAAGESSKQQLRKEIWFVVDCSGSMSGSPIQQARQAALFFVRDLPVDSGVRFNVTVFGSSHNSLYNSCKPYDSKTEKEAVAWIQNKVHANLGGTEILATLQHIYSSPIAAGYTREIIFLTDGGISGHEEQAVYDLVNPKANKPVPAASHTHVLSLGIGHGVHRALLDGMSVRSDGAAVYVVDDEAIAAKTAFLKKASTAAGAVLRPRLVARNALVRPAPHVLPQRVFAGEPLHVLMEVVSAEPDASVELTAEWADPAAAGSAAPLTLCLPLGPALASSAEEGEALPVLHAMAYIGSLMAGTSPLHVRPDGTPLAAPPSADTVKEAVVRLAVAEHLVTPHTSAVGVSLRRDPAAPEAGANVVEVPLQLPHGRALWGTAPGSAGPLAVCSYGAPLAMAPRRNIMATGSPTVMMMRCSAAPPPPPCPMPQMAMGGGGGRSRCAAFDSAEWSLARGEKIGDLVCMSESLKCDADMFVKQGKALKKKSAAASLGGAVGALFGGLFGSGGGSSRGSASAAAAATPSAAMAAPAPVGGGGRAASPCAAEPQAEQEEACRGMSYGGVQQKEAAARRSRSRSRSRSISPPAPAAAAVSPPRSQLRGSELLAFLNLKRTTQGYWAAGAELAAALGVPASDLAAVDGDAGSRASASAAAALRPAGLTDDAWATVVVLAVLRRCLAAQREVWADMEAKALGWLAAAWPEGGRSVGSTVLALAKALSVSEA